MKNIKKFNETISDSIVSKEDDDLFLINGSGLFFFKSNLSNDEKLKIVKWYNKLSDEDKENVNILRNEAADETEYYENSDY